MAYLRGENEIELTYRVRFSVGMLLMLFLTFAAGWFCCDCADSLRWLLDSMIATSRPC